jgi:hypothetical protein
MVARLSGLRVDDDAINNNKGKGKIALCLTN